MADFDLETLQTELARRETEPWVLPRAEQVNPELRSRFEEMARDFHDQVGIPLRVTDTYRSRADQADVYRRKPNLAVAPGKSRHEYGDAIDIDQSQVPTLEKLGLIDKYGFTRPALGKGETWHLELPRFEKASKIAAINQDYSLEDLQTELSKREGQSGEFSLEELQAELAKREQPIASPVRPPKGIKGIIQSGNKWAQENPEAAVMAGAPEAAWGWLNQQTEQSLSLPTMTTRRKYIGEPSKSEQTLIPSPAEVSNIGAQFGFKTQPDFRPPAPHEFIRSEKEPEKIKIPELKRIEELWGDKPDVSMGEKFLALITNPKVALAFGGERPQEPSREEIIKVEPERGIRRPQVRQEVISERPSTSGELIGKNIVAFNYPVLKELEGFAGIAEDILALPYQTIVGSKNKIERPFSFVAKQLTELGAPEELRPTEKERFATLPGQVVGGIASYMLPGKLLSGVKAGNILERYLMNLGTFLPADVARGYAEAGEEGAKHGLTQAPLTAAMFTVAQILPGYKLQSVGTGTAFAAGARIAGETDPINLIVDFLTGVGLHVVGSRGGAKREKFEKFVEDFKKENNVTPEQWKTIEEFLGRPDVPPEAPPPLQVETTPPEVTIPRIPPERGVETRIEAPIEEIPAQEQPTPAPAKGRETWEMTESEFKKDYPEGIVTEIKTIPLKDIEGIEYAYGTSGKKQLMEDKAKYLQGYIDKFKTGDTPPPIGVHAPRPGVKEKYRIYDGHRRVLAAERAGLKEISAEIVYVNEEGTPVTHYIAVLKALKEGKPVPSAVLVEYPDLATKYQARLPRAEGVTEAAAENRGSYEIIDVEGNKIQKKGIIIGDYAVTKDYGKYTIDHIPTSQEIIIGRSYMPGTGHKIGIFERQKDAIEAAKKLQEANIDLTTKSYEEQIKIRQKINDIFSGKYPGPESVKAGRGRATEAAAEKAAPEYSPAVKEGMEAWLRNEAYIDNAGNYRLKENKKITPWNKEVKKAFPRSEGLTDAAEISLPELATYLTEKETKWGKRARYQPLSEEEFPRISKPVPASEKGAVGFDIREPQSPKDPELVAAQEKVSSRISRDEHIEKEPIKAGQIYTSLVDRLHPLKQLIDRYASNPSVIGKDIYKQARLFVGWHGKAEAFIDYHPFDRKNFEFDTKAKSLKEIVKPLEEQGKLQDFDDFLVARRAIEREGRGFKTGVDLEAAQTVVDKLGPEFKEAAKDFDTYMDSLLRYMRDSQMINPERYQQIKANSLDYAPFMRLFEPEKVAGGGKGYEARQIIKAFKGSERKIISPLESAVKLTYGMVNASERNQVGTSLIAWAKEVGAMGKEINAISPKKFPVEVTMKEIFRNPEIKKLLEESGLSQEEATIFRPSAFRPAENVISVWENGKRKFYEVPKDIADIIQGLDQSTVDIWTRIISAPAQALRLGATTLSPEFGLRNFFKDQFPAFIHSKYGYKPLIDFMRGVTELSKGGEDYWKYMISGAPHAELVSMDRRMLQKKLKDITSGKLTMPGFLVRHPIEALKILSEYSEMGTRLGEFKKGIKAGEDIQEAGFTARELTVDFGRRGASTKALNMLVAFWNANIQGLDRVIRAHRDNPFGTIVKATAAITIPSLLLEMAFHDDDRYQNLPWWRKDLFYNIPTAVGVISLPKPWTYGLLYGSIPQRIANYIMTDNPHAFDKLATAIGRELPDFPVPTGIKPFIEIWANKSFFFDRPIVPTWKEQLPPKFQYGEWNSEVAKQLGRIIGKIPVIGDTKSASPAVIDHFVMSWTGGAGRLALNAVDYTLRETGAVHAIPKPTRVLADYPIVRAFVSRYPSADAQPIKDFYDNIKELQSKKQALKQIGETLALQGRKDELSSLIKEMQPEASLNLTNMQKAVSNAHKYIDRVHSHPNMNPEQKRETIERTYLSIINMTKKVNMAIDKVRDQKQKLGRGQ